MAFSKDQNEPNMPIGNQETRQSSDFLPRFFRTNTNQKFLGATLDQMISKGEVDKINAYIGRRNAKSRLSDDRYLEDVSTDREAYQLEPAVLIQDSLENVTFFKDYNDYINQIKFFNYDTVDHSTLNRQEFYSWNPHISWDKFVNYREYYWLPTGPQSVGIAGQSDEIVSEYSVSLADDGDNKAYIFGAVKVENGNVTVAEGLVRNPKLRLYRGQTYRFKIDCPGHPIAFKTVRDTSDSYFYVDGITKTTLDGADLDTVWVETGYITLVIPVNAPKTIFYVSQNDINTSGSFKVFDITDASEIDVEKEIIGKVNYSNADVVLSNGMKVYFKGRVTPEKYSTGNWYVEGVGTKIVLVDERNLETPAIFTTTENIEFDNENFDTQGFDVNSNYPATKDYITINRGSRDRNTWSRYNRWFHRSVIETSARLNDQEVVLDQNARAARPIIEFNAGLQLFAHGRQAKANVDLVDTFTKDVFSTIEGTFGYIIDGVSLREGHRVLFLADTDVKVTGRIFKVQKITHLGQSRISLVEETDTEPRSGETVLALYGNAHRGKMYYFNGDRWIPAQEKIKVNQPPLFDVFDSDNVSFSDQSVYVGSSFSGTKLFSYATGSVLDSVLNFAIKYKNIQNIGDIVFDFNLHKDTFTYQDLIKIKELSLDVGYLHLHTGLELTEVVNGWTRAAAPSVQPVIRQYTADISLVNFFLIDVYDNSASLTDLTTDVYVNDKKQTILDYTVYRQDNNAYIQFFEDLAPGASVIIETQSSAKKNSNGYYKFPINLESNPENLSLNDVTLGEIFNHVQTIVTSAPQFIGATPGVSNLRDLGQVSQYGKKIIQHSGPLMPVVYHITDKKFNVISALRKAREDYSKFKRNLIRVSTDYGFDGITRVHLDTILKDLTKEKIKESPYYLSDMVPFGANFVFAQTVIDDSIVEYPLTFDFDLSTPSDLAVLVYLNEKLLTHSRDYEFNNSNFVRIKVPLVTGDELEIVQYSTTNGCCIPPTPSKLGLYPAYEPKIFNDDTYQTLTKVIQGHDGSITVAFNDYRDDLLLEFETRIYNNIKVTYDPEYFNIHDYVEGYSRKTDVLKDDLNGVLRQEFLKWAMFISQDFTKHSFYNASNPFTFNYNSFNDASGNQLSGYWRGVFQYFYDTDRPHTHPWEMLGFTIKPVWWEQAYGTAPYTSDNLIMWTDLSEGFVREPGKAPLRLSRYIRPSLLNQIPVDAYGKLKPPVVSNLVANYVFTDTNREFRFGDHAPVESAWRKSSEYPFALLTGLTIVQPAKMFAQCFDRVRQFRDEAGQLVYRTEDGNLRLSPKHLVFPNTVNDNTRIFTSGLVNYIVDYAITGSALTLVDELKQNVFALQTKLSSKLGGFSSKEKFKLILDSRTPLNQGNVFIPEENYNIILNTSTPVQSISYSAVIIEKQSSGFIVRGYNKDIPEFKYFKHIEVVSDPVINVGGISATFVNWDTEKYYAKGTIVSYSDAYYMTTTSHTSSTIFEIKFYTKLVTLPVEGGREVIIRRKFSTAVTTLHYGIELEKIQDVVDFLLGYGEYLKSVGFIFDSYNPVLKTVIDWQTSAKEFAFWTTQNWEAGAVISLSPSAEELKLTSNFSVVDNIYDSFYDYSIFKENGTPLDPTFISSSRKGGSFTVEPKNTTDGIYHINLNLVQKEHVLILDNSTVFNDIIYDQQQGYRQERIKILGYRTSGWQGDFSIPGFIYDRAQVFEWTPWKDYALGETVKYKEFYYSAKQTTPGTEKFEFNSWFKLDKRPESKLIPNWEYRATQFTDFYELETDSFDANQQKFAQHLIGYQKRAYLENIINDDVSQYKFYQGMIQEKGTKNSLSKLFDALNTADKDSLEFYEEWAIRLGQYGASEGFDEVELLLDESKFYLNPQPIELVDILDPTVDDLVYRITPDQVYLAPEKYTHAPLPTTTVPSQFLTSAGYVNASDVKYIIRSKEDLVNYSIRSLRNGDYFWAGFDKTSWNIYKFGLFVKNVESASLEDTNLLRFTIDRNVDADVVANEYIGVIDPANIVTGIYKVVNVGFNYVEIAQPESVNDDKIVALSSNVITLYKFTRHRIKDIDQLNSLYLSKKRDGDLVWVDNNGYDWEVWRFANTFKTRSVSLELLRFGKTISVTDNDNIMAVASTDTVSYYVRPNTAFEWTYNSRVTASNVPVFNFTLLSNYESAFDPGANPTISTITYKVNNITQGSIPAGILRSNYTVKVDASNPVFTALGVNESRTVSLQYTITNSLNQTVSATQTITVTGTELTPRVVSTMALIPITTYGSFGDTVVFIDSDATMVVAAPEYVDLSYGPSTGYLAIFTKDDNDYYTYSSIIVPSLAHTEIKFGFRMVTHENFLIVASQGSQDIPGAVSVFNIQDNTLLGRMEMSAGQQIRDIAISNIGTLVIGTSSNMVNVVSISSAGSLTSVQTLTMPEQVTALFGWSVAITNDGNTIAVGAPQYHDKHPNQGAIRLFEKVNSVYEEADTIFSPNTEESEEFGYLVKFNKSGTKIVSYCQGGSYFNETTFDVDTTEYDLRTTTFGHTMYFIGTVQVFERLNSKFVFVSNVEVETPQGSYYGSNVVVTENIYVNDPASSTGAVYEFYSTGSPWSKFRSAEPRVDLEKIKSIFLYDTLSNKVITYLDVVDAYNGKILGVAEQELSYKTYYDPAVYSTGTAEVITNELMSWNGENVGKLWWDLSTVKFLDANQSSVIYKSNTQNTLFPGSSIDIYEWVETEYLPSEWDSLADTEEGLSQNISGTSKYGDTVYSTSRRYDNVSKVFVTVYYFWVKNKVTVPPNPFRNISAKDVALYIEDPKSKGVKYVTLLGANQLALINCKELIDDARVAINIRYWIIKNKDVNVHAQYQLIASGDPTSKINPYIEKKWFDSLIGYDIQGLIVPDPTLPPKLKYGIMSRPRQGMFVNRLEALKQFIERVNTVLGTYDLLSNADISSLYQKEEEPLVSTRTFDQVVDTNAELRFADILSFRPATLEALIQHGEIIEVTVINGGKGYGTLTPYEYNVNGDPVLWYGPAITINGPGAGANLISLINYQGIITSVIVDKGGAGYFDTVSLSIRPYTVLVLSDEVTNGKWSLYELNPTHSWNRIRTQTFDTTKYWSATDWYKSGYNQFTKVNYEVNFTYEIPFKTIQLGDVVRIKYNGTTGWILLEKTDDQPTQEISVNYSVIGRQGGTIQFNSSIYQFADNDLGFDGPIYDNALFDEQPKEELRIILNCIRDNLLVDELSVEYNNLFFANLRYVLSEQPFVDWAFKTSFVKSKHNLGTLEEKITFQPDNLSNYASYIDEVKPYRSKVREFVSSFEKVDNTQSIVTDFDLQSRYDITSDAIKSFKVKVLNGQVEYDSQEILQAPFVNWYDNVGYGIIEIRLIDAGSGYVNVPEVLIDGIATESATVSAYLSGEKVGGIAIQNSGSGYLETPTVRINGVVREGGRQAKAVAILGNGLVRSQLVGVKFDRISSNYLHTDLLASQSFIGSRSTSTFNLRWPMSLDVSTVLITVNGQEILQSEFTISNEIDSSLSYTAYKGRVRIVNTEATIPSISTVVITYKKDIILLDAADRIQHYYTPKPGQIGKDLGQLMTGVDYGGVEVSGINFGVSTGWDVLPWFTTTWDSYDITFTDYAVKIDEEVRTFQLPYLPADEDVVNIYLNNIRIDDMNYGTDDPVTNPNAVMSSFVGDGATSQIFIPASVVYPSGSNILTFRKSTSDGSSIPFESVYDTELSGGALNYSSASGLSVSDIIVDGDEFITSISSGAPEEVVPGHSVDTVDIKMFNTVAGGAPLIIVSNYKVSNPLIRSYAIGQTPPVGASVLVKIDNVIKKDEYEYFIDYATKSVVFVNDIPENSLISIVSLSLSGKGVLDIGEFTGDGSTIDFVTQARWDNEYTLVVTVNGQPNTQFTQFISSETDVYNNSISFAFDQPPADGSIISYVVVTGSDISAVNTIQKQNILYTTGINTYPITIPLRSDLPIEVSSIVEINGTVLRPSKFVYFDVVGASRTYKLDNNLYPFNSIDTTEILVYLNGKKLTVSRDFSWTSSTNELKIKRGVASSGDVIILEIFGDAQYRIEQDELGNGYNISLANVYPDTTEVTVTVFSNDQTLEITRTSNYITVLPGQENNSIEYYTYNQQTGGRFKLRAPALASQYVWVTVNEELLTPEIDYILEDDRMVIRIDPTIILNTDSIVGIIAFSSTSISAPFGYRIFKDMLNNVSYVRIDDTVSTELTAPLEFFDDTINLSSTSGLANPDIAANRPGVIMLDGERIEYFIKNDTSVSQLRRGTFGTGIKTVYPIETKVQDFSAGQFIPYADRLESVMAMTDGYSVADQIYRNSDSVQVTSIEINTNDGSASPAGGNIVTVIGSGFGSSVVAYVGDTELTVTRISSERIRFTTPGKTVGKYDLVIVNPNVVEAEITSRVVSSAIEYRKVSLEFTPTKANISNWYRDTIPETYGQCNDIEVFVAGRRLRKAPLVSWNYTIGPDSLSGDETLEAEFSVDGTTNEIRLTEIPPAGVAIRVFRRTGSMWTPSGVSLMDAETDPARFIRAKIAELPNTKYYDTTVDTIIRTETGQPIQTETGTPLESE